MADQERTMEDALPAKRARFDFCGHNEDDTNKNSNKKSSSVSETLTGNGGESTLTSDSGFNEFTPPHSIEDENTTAARSSQSYCFERNEFEVGTPKQGGVENTSPEDDNDDDACSVGSTASNLSGISNLSNLSGKDWKPCAGPMSWVQQQMVKGVNPRSVLTQILGGSWQIPHGVSDFMLWHIILNMLSDPPKRERLRHINTLEDVLRLIKVCKKIIVLTGAGVSVSCGIPDFRSKNGIYARLSVDFPDLPDPQAMFDIHYFRRDPRPFFKFAREIYPGQFTPSLCHKFIRLIEQNNKLLRNYTQNIDTLEQVAGIERVIQCHGSFATATCQRCSHKVDANAIKEDIFTQHIPKCKVCSDTSSEGVDYGSVARETASHPSQRLGCFAGQVATQVDFNPSGHFRPQPNPPDGEGKLMTTDIGASLEAHQPIRNDAACPEPVMKPDIVFFGEGLPDEFHDRMAEDKDECDLLIVIGSSLKVRPVALIPSSIPPNVPQILINREPLGHLTFDVELLGDCDVIVGELCRRLGNSWSELSSGEALSEIQELPPRTSEGAEGDASGSPQQPTPEEAPHPKDESDIEALRACWAPKVKESMAARLPEGKFLFCGGHRYVFPGAEVYYDPDDEDSDSQSTDSESDGDVDEGEPTETLHNGTENPAPAHLEATAEPFHQRLSASCESASSDVEGVEDRSSLGINQGHRRNSQALSEDVDSLLSAASCDPTNNTPDHPSDGQWGCSERTPTGDLANPATNSNSIEDWTNLSASIDGTSSTTQPEEVEGHFEISSQKGNGKMGIIERRDGSLSQASHCLV